MAEKCAFIKPDGVRCGAWSMKDSEYCVAHDERFDMAELGRQGGKLNRYKVLPPSEMPEIDIDEHDDLVIPVLQRAVEQLEAMRVTPETMRTLGNVASALDRAMERRANRGADVQRIEVTYTNDWRT